jgi:hypothetical protein
MRAHGVDPNNYSSKVERMKQAGIWQQPKQPKNDDENTTQGACCASYA